MNYELRKQSAKIYFAFVPWVIYGLFFFLTNIPKVSAQKPFAITNYFTERYRDFPMMKISIIPPECFTKDTDQVGFLDSKDAAAIRAEEIKQGVHTTSADFFKLFDSTRRNDSLGVKLLELYNFNINGYEAHLVNVLGKIEGDDYLQWWIFIGDTSDTYIVKSFIPTGKKKVLEQQVRSALLSVFYEPDRRLIPFGVDPTTTSSSACNCHNKK
jgi:hypothetical protein